MLTVKLSRIRPFCGRMPSDLRLGINDLAARADSEDADKLLTPHWIASRASRTSWTSFSTPCSSMNGDRMKLFRPTIGSP